MAKHGRGLICLALPHERVDELGLKPMERRNSSRFETAFLTSIEASEGVTTGISAADRAHTIRVAIDPQSKPDDINQNKDLHQYVKKNYLRSSTLIYKNDSKESYLVVCKNQTCSNKIKTIEELKSVVKNYAI